MNYKSNVINMFSRRFFLSITLLFLLFLMAACTGTDTQGPQQAPVESPQAEGNEQPPTAATNFCARLKTASGAFVYTAQDAQTLLGGPTWKLKETRTLPSGDCWVEMEQEASYGKIGVRTVQGPEKNLFDLYTEEQITADQGRFVIGVGEKTYFDGAGFLWTKQGEHRFMITCSKAGPERTRAPKIRCSDEEHVSIARTVLSRVS